MTTMEIDSGGVPIHVEVTGEGRPVVLLHGFPDSGALWRHQVPVLADAGFQVIVPDLRGFGASGCPPEVEDYSILYTIGDIVAVLDHLGVARAHVVGHDFGAATAWAMAAFLPDRVDHLVTLSVGQASAFRSVGVRQLEKSWYMFFFQFPGVGEAWLSADDWANFRAVVRPPGHRGHRGPVGGHRFVDLRPQLVPGQHPARRLRRAAARAAGGGGAHPGRMEQRRLRPDRGADGPVRSSTCPVRGATSGSRGPATGCSSRRPTRSTASCSTSCPPDRTDG